MRNFELSQLCKICPGTVSKKGRGASKEGERAWMISFCRSVIICLLSHTEVKVWTSGFQNRSSRRSPAFYQNDQDITNLSYNYTSQQDFWTIFFLPKSEYLLTLSYGGEGLDFWLSEQVVKTESSLLPKQLGHQEYTIQLHLLNKTLVDTIRSDPRYSSVLTISNTARTQPVVTLTIMRVTREGF